MAYKARRRIGHQDLGQAFERVVAARYRRWHTHTHTHTHLQSEKERERAQHLLSQYRTTTPGQYRAW
eukprot:2330352-Rhodomonas_salina.1